jgi:hypothetical protein
VLNVALTGPLDTLYLLLFVNAIFRDQMTLSGPLPNPPVAEVSVLDPARLDGTNINPVTGLATDYLNHFNEAVMLLELLPTMPECKDDLLAWKPATYREHFAASGFKHRDLAIAAYEIADPVFRRELDEIAEHMNAILTTTRDGLARDLSPDTIRILAESTANWLKPLVARAGAVINGEVASADPSADAVPQDAIDALFDQEIESALQP